MLQVDGGLRRRRGGCGVAAFRRLRRPLAVDWPSPARRGGKCAGGDSLPYGATARGRQGHFVLTVPATGSWQPWRMALSEKDKKGRSPASGCSLAAKAPSTGTGGALEQPIRAPWGWGVPFPFATCVLTVDEKRGGCETDWVAHTPACLERRWLFPDWTCPVWSRPPVSLFRFSICGLFVGD